MAGDGDHGSGMARGSRAAADAADATEGGVQTVLAAAGAAFGDKAGGTSGILWGVLLDAAGRQLGNTEPVTGERLVEAVRQSADQLKAFSKAELGDKTMLDALFPFVDGAGRQDRGRRTPRPGLAGRGGGLPVGGRGHGVLDAQDRAGATAGRAERGHPGSGGDLAEPDRHRDR